MSRIGLSYTSPNGGGAYNFILDNFGGFELPRSYEASASFSDSANGATLSSGPAYKQKHQWVISTIMPKGDAVDFDSMFGAWDADRGLGLPVACGLVDTTFGPEVQATVVFVTPPSYTHMGPGFTLVSFGLKEV